LVTFVLIKCLQILKKDEQLHAVLGERKGKGHSVQTYIVKIYRQRPDSHRSIVGMVEEVGVNGKKAFNTYDELWEIVNPAKQTDAGKTHPPHLPDKEKRRHRRSEASYFTVYSSVLSSGDIVSNGVIANISKSGLCLLTPIALDEGENIQLKGDDNSPAQRAMVRWCRQYKNCHYRAGVEFVA
jgi:hypothetical protein